MVKFNFLTLFIFASVSFLFIKIYQHNKNIQLSYKKQRLEAEKSKLKKERDELAIRLFKLKNPKRVKKIAKNKLGLVPIKLSQIKKKIYLNKQITNKNINNGQAT